MALGPGDPTLASPGMVVGILAVTVCTSLLASRPAAEHAEQLADEESAEFTS